MVRYRLYRGKYKLKIGKKYFSFYTWKKTKQEADRYAEMLRRGGTNVRVLQRHPNGNKWYMVMREVISHKKNR